LVARSQGGGGGNLHKKSCRYRLVANCCCPGGTFAHWTTISARVPSRGSSVGDARVERRRRPPARKMMISLALRNTEHLLPTTAAGPQRLTPLHVWVSSWQKKTQVGWFPIVRWWRAGSEAAEATCKKNCNTPWCGALPWVNPRLTRGIEPQNVAELTTKRRKSPLARPSSPRLIIV